MSLAIASKKIPPSEFSTQKALDAFTHQLLEYPKQQSVNVDPLKQVMLFLALSLRLKKIAARQIEIDKQWQKLGKLS